ncbi:uncharacterized protein LOC18013789 isoform X2 [Eutrema salsugineum]|uniref:uncharacterized protein LOC18013789 isoform X2 n=1 Tax=Eutrema salsugineum TaxID=72664 RepID=UPI000CED08AA|nr:uncharacterized protein LOC18013789 isoform X2 [Eutrema salsugineum]
MSAPEQAPLPPAEGAGLEEGEIGIVGEVIEESQPDGRETQGLGQEKHVGELDRKESPEVKEAVSTSLKEVVGVEPIGKTWSSVVAEKSRLQKYEVVVEEVDGVETIQVPDDVFDNAPPLWEDCIIGKFVSKAPHVGFIHMTVNKIWTLGSKTIKVDVFVVDDTTVKFKIPDASIRARVLRRGMWSIKNIPMMVSKWSPYLEEVQPEVRYLPMWVTLRNVPRSMFTWKGLSFLTSPLGEPKKLHPDTLWAKSFEEAKVFVEVNLSQKLPESFSFKSKRGVDTIVQYEFPWLPPRCVLCAKWGHEKAECKAQPGDKTILQRGSPLKDCVTGGSKSINVSGALAVVSDISKGKGKELAQDTNVVESAKRGEGTSSCNVSDDR